MAEQGADFVTILSSELIADVVERYFNSELYKVPVKVKKCKVCGKKHGDNEGHS